MDVNRVSCDQCGGLGYTVSYEPDSYDPKTRIGKAKRKEIKCENCDGRGWFEYATFSVEEAKAILQHCGLIEAKNTEVKNINTERSFQIGDIVQHFKRETLAPTDDQNKYLYIIRGFANHTETDEMLVIYQGLYSPFDTYARPYDIFNNKVDKERYPNIKQEYRFEVKHFG